MKRIRITTDTQLFTDLKQYVLDDGGCGCCSKSKVFPHDEEFDHLDPIGLSDLEDAENQLREGLELIEALRKEMQNGAGKYPVL